jgi:hypothetical protein
LGLRSRWAAHHDTLALLDLAVTNADKEKGPAMPSPNDSVLSSMMHEESYEYDDGKGDSDQPK